MHNEEEAHSLATQVTDKLHLWQQDSDRLCKLLLALGADRQYNSAVSSPSTDTGQQIRRSRARPVPVDSQGQPVYMTQVVSSSEDQQGVCRERTAKDQENGGDAARQVNMDRKRDKRLWGAGRRGRCGRNQELL